MGDVPPAPALGAQWHGTEGPRLLPLLCGSARNLIKISTPWQTTLGSVVFLPHFKHPEGQRPSFWVLVYLCTPGGWHLVGIIHCLSHE